MDILKVKESFFNEFHIVLAIYIKKIPEQQFRKK